MYAPARWPHEEVPPPLTAHAMPTWTTAGLQMVDNKATLVFRYDTASMHDLWRLVRTACYMDWEVVMVVLWLQSAPKDQSEHLSVLESIMQHLPELRSTIVGVVDGVAGRAASHILAACDAVIMTSGSELVAQQTFVNAQHAAELGLADIVVANLDGVMQSLDWLYQTQCKSMTLRHGENMYRAQAIWPKSAPHAEMPSRQRMTKGLVERHLMSGTYGPEILPSTAEERYGAIEKESQNYYGRYEGHVAMDQPHSHRARAWAHEDAGPSRASATRLDQFHAAGVPTEQFRSDYLGWRGRPAQAVGQVEYDRHGDHPYLTVAEAASSGSHAEKPALLAYLSRRRAAMQTCCSSTQQQSLAVPITNYMICNIPCRFSEEEVIAAVHDVGFAGRYESVSVPLRNSHGRRVSNLGYGFIKFADPQDGVDFVQAFTGYSFPGTVSKKAISVEPAKVQGFGGSYAFDSSGPKCMDSSTTTQTTHATTISGYNSSASLQNARESRERDSDSDFFCRRSGYDVYHSGGHFEDIVIPTILQF
eukprot:TRINITY_DN112640_c0_g1_i1.p1 TRINITY_DN112640_c0_g1~~TRINITY_DN112640_c0_g1_i1.p1  ORF type:complete len:533 (-),score=76.57 TRINITY_DN112640_c0_g1_i1:92-1690(-)